MIISYVDTHFRWTDSEYKRQYLKITYKYVHEDKCQTIQLHRYFFIFYFSDNQLKNKYNKIIWFNIRIFSLYPSVFKDVLQRNFVEFIGNIDLIKT